MNTPTINYKNIVSTFVVAGGLFFALGSNALAQTADRLQVSATGNSALAEFSRSTPCTPYVLSWGDGVQVEETSDAELCIQVIDDVSLRHTYDAAGTYTIVLEMGGDSWSAEIAVTEESVTTEPTTSFGLAAVDTITYTWVDPDKMMADEEYYVYTITLNTGEVVTFQVPSFTTLEYRNEQFAKVGYTGDVDALLERATEIIAADKEVEDDVTAEQQLIGLYQQLQGLLEEMLLRLQALLRQ